MAHAEVDAKYRDLNDKYRELCRIRDDVWEQKTSVENEIK